MIKNNHKNHLHTTLSDKHRELLKRHTEKFGTHQKTLEVALESLENPSQSHAPSLEEMLIMRLLGIRSAVFLYRDVFNELIRTVDLVRMREIFKTAPLMIEWYYQKPLKKCSLKEIMDVIVIYFRAGNYVDTIDYTDNGDHYYLKMLHSLNPKNSEMAKMLCESLCEAYGVKMECELSEKNTVFVKVYKNI